MRLVTSEFSHVYRPVRILALYNNRQAQLNRHYCEAYDIDRTGKPVNAHPLDMAEAKKFSKALLEKSGKKEHGFWLPKNILPANILFLHPDPAPLLIWQTPPMKANLLFIESLGIPSGSANLPSLIWKANKSELYLYALANDKRATGDTLLYHAPFFNMHQDGRVCMGNVHINFSRQTCPVEFVQKWQEYFFNSYFSHSIGTQAPVKGNIVSFWKDLIGTNKVFPVKQLIKTNHSLKSLLS